MTPTISPGVRGYLYKYQPNHNLFSTDGDVSMLITNFFASLFPLRYTYCSCIYPYIDKYIIVNFIIDSWTKVKTINIC